MNTGSNSYGRGPLSGLFDQTPSIREPFSEEWIAALNDVGRRFGEALTLELERIGRAYAPLIEALRKAYRDAGALYGDTDDGMFQWISELRVETDEQWRREKEESIRETCEMLRGHQR